MGFLELTNIFYQRFDKEDFLEFFRVLESRDMSPSQWDRQIQFWSSIIKQWANENNVFEFVVQDVCESLEYNSAYPNLLPTIQFLIDIKICRTRDDYLNKKSFLGTFATSIFSPLVSKTITKDTLIVFCSNVSIACQNIQRRIVDNAAFSSDLILTNHEISTMSEKCSENLVFAELEKSGLAERINENGYYFNSKGFKRPPNVSIVSVLNTKAIIKRLDVFIDQIHSHIENAINRARNHEKNRRHQEAISSIQSKRKYENELIKAQNTKYKLEQILNSIGDHEMNNYMINVMNQVSKVSKSSMTINDVDKVMEQLEETQYQTKEIGDALTRDTFAHDNDEIERELEIITGLATPKKTFAPKQNIFEYQKKPTQAKRVGFSFQIPG